MPSSGPTKDCKSAVYPSDQPVGRCETPPRILATSLQLNSLSSSKSAIYFVPNRDTPAWAAISVFVRASVDETGEQRFEFGG